MPDISAPAISQLQERRGTEAYILLWLIGRNRDTGEDESIGFWTGDDHQLFTVGGESRLYYGAGAVIGVDDVVAPVGRDVRRHRVILPPMLDEVRQALRVYEPRQARVEVHHAIMDPSSGDLLHLWRVIKGRLNGAPEDIDLDGGESATELMIVSTARRGTFGLPLLRSNDQLRRRNANDRFREYSDVAGEWVVPWGTERDD